MSPPIDPTETGIQVALRLALASVVGTALLVLLVLLALGLEAWLA